MKRKCLSTIVICIFLLVIAVSAQTTKPNYAGVWDLGEKSFPTEIKMGESMRLKVVQTENRIAVEQISMRVGLYQGDGNDGEAKKSSLFRGNMSSLGTDIFSLDEKETVIIFNHEKLTGKTTRKAIVSPDGRLSLITTCSAKNPTGIFTIKINETWELLDEKTLKISRNLEMPSGMRNEEMYFIKKSSDETILTAEGRILSRDEPNVKILTGSILNGKAITLPKPEYPAEARAAKASGAVNVIVTIDEQGSVIEARAITGHPLLRQAAEDAARNAKFPAILHSGVPVQYGGDIIYSFTP